MTGPELTPAIGPDDHVAGPHDAPVTLVEYGDFECPYCGEAYPIVKEMQKRMGDQLRLAFRNFPLSESHPHALHAAEAAEAAGAQGNFWEMHDLLYENQDALGDRDLVRYAGALGLDARQLGRELEAGTFEEAVREDFRSGVRSGVNGTPTFFLNGVRSDARWNDPVEFLRALEHAAGGQKGHRKA